MESGKPTHKRMDDGAYEGMKAILTEIKSSISYDRELMDRVKAVINTTNEFTKNGYVDTEHFSLNVIGTLAVLTHMYKSKPKSIVIKFKDDCILFLVVNSFILTGKAEKTNADAVSTYAEDVIRLTNLPRTFVDYSKKDVKDMCRDYQDICQVIIW